MEATPFPFPFDLFDDPESVSSLSLRLRFDPTDVLSSPSDDISIGVWPSRFSGASALSDEISIGGVPPRVSVPVLLSSDDNSIGVLSLLFSGMGEVAEILGPGDVDALLGPGGGRCVFFQEPK